MNVFYKDYSKDPNHHDIAIYLRLPIGHHKLLATGIETLTEAQRICQVAKLALEEVGCKLVE